MYIHSPRSITRLILQNSSNEVPRLPSQCIANWVIADIQKEFQKHKKLSWSSSFTANWQKFQNSCRQEPRMRSQTFNLFFFKWKRNPTIHSPRPITIHEADSTARDWLIHRSKGAVALGFALLVFYFYFLLSYMYMYF